MESNGDNPIYEKPGSFTRLYRNIQRGLRNMSGIGPVQHEASKSSRPESSLVNNEHELAYGDEFQIPEELFDGKTMVVFGKSTDTQDPKYIHFEAEHGVNLIPNIRGIPRRAVGFIFSEDGTVRIRNLWDNNLTFGLSESQRITMEPGKTFALNPNQDKGNLRVDLPEGYMLRTGSYGGAGNEKPKVMSLMFTKSRS